MTDGVHALVQTVQPPVAFPPANRVLTKAAPLQVPEVNHPLRACGDPSKPPITARAGFSALYAAFPAFA